MFVKAGASGYWNSKSRDEEESKQFSKRLYVPEMGSGHHQAAMEAMKNLHLLGSSKGNQVLWHPMWWPNAGLWVPQDPRLNLCSQPKPMWKPLKVNMMNKKQENL